MAALAFLTLLVAQAPVASAHGGAVSGLSGWHGLLVLAAGLLVVGVVVVLKRTGRLSPTAALSGVFAGIVVTALGAILFEGLTPDATFAASTMPFPRSWYRPITLAVGLLVAVSSFVVGWLRWPTRPRYTFLGILVGLWVAYPALLPGIAGDSHPLGYAIVLATPVLVGYVLWTDARELLGAVRRDPVARRFGAGVGFVVALFFMAATGYLSFFPESNVPDETVVTVLPVVYQLVTWPTLEVGIPQIPLFFAVSVGVVVLVGLLGTLVGLNAALVARHWRVEERPGTAEGTAAGTTEGTAGAAAVLGSCTCGCCGPLVVKFAVVAAGPSLAAPLYWVFVDPASPLGSLFLVAALLLFTGSLVYAVEEARGPGQEAPAVPVD